MSSLARQRSALRCASAGRVTEAVAATTTTAKRTLRTTSVSASTSTSAARAVSATTAAAATAIAAGGAVLRPCRAWCPHRQHGSGPPLISGTATTTATKLDTVTLASPLRLRPHRPTTSHPQAWHLIRLSSPPQRRVLQTSCTSSSPAPSSSSSSPCSSSTSSAAATSSFLAATPLEPRSRRRSFPRLRSHLRATYLPAIVMGATLQTRDSADDHHPRNANAKSGKQHDHDHGHEGHHGHSHSHGIGHHHHHDNTYLLSKNRSDPGVRITNIGLASNLAMAIAKFVGGWAFGSKSMVADGWHSVTDLASDILTLATVSWSITPPTDRFPLGFGKVESFGALGVSGMLIVGGCYMGWESALVLYEHFNPEAAHAIIEHVGHGHTHSHSPAAMGIPSIHAAWLAAGTILVKEWLYHATMKVAREKHSSVLASNAIHHRVDSLTGIVTLVAIVGANVVENAGWLDPVGGLLISIMVAHAGIGNMKDAFYELIDQSIDDEVKDSVRRQAVRAIEDFNTSHKAQLRDVGGVKSGQNYLIDLEMAVPGSWTVEHVREMEAAIRVRVGAKVRGVKRVRVRFVSLEEPVKDKFDEFIEESGLSRLEDAKEESEDQTNGKTKGYSHSHSDGRESQSTRQRQQNSNNKD